MLAASVRTIGERLGKSKTTAARALLELEEAGFIETVKVGRFARRDRMASEYRLTFHRCDVSHAPPSKAFMKAVGTVPQMSGHSFTDETVDAEMPEEAA